MSTDPLILDGFRARAKKAERERDGFRERLRRAYLEYTDYDGPDVDAFVDGHVADLHDLIQQERGEKKEKERQLAEARACIEALELLVSAKDGLLVAYRLQRPPSEACWKKLERAEKALAALSPPKETNAGRARWLNGEWEIEARDHP